jgi:hypothetical protein
VWNDSITFHLVTPTEHTLRRYRYRGVGPACLEHIVDLGMGSSDFSISDFWSLICGARIWWDQYVNDLKSGKVRIGKLEDSAPVDPMPWTVQLDSKREGSADIG